MAELMVTGIGIATTDPELRHVGEGKTAVCTVNLAFNRSFRRQNSEKWETETCFVRGQVWGARAERMAELVKKGQPMYVTGYMKQDSWEDKEGNKRFSYSINLRDFQLCVKNGKKKNETKPENATEAPAPSPVDDESLPF